MNIGKPKVMSIVFLLLGGLLLSNFAAEIKAAEAATSEDTLILTARSRAETPEAGDELMVLYNQLEPKPSQTAIIICDMWNKHWCKGATRRVAELAPRMNEVISVARDKGVLIIHAPSGTVEHYKDHPARKRAQNAPCPAISVNGANGLMRPRKRATLSTSPMAAVTASRSVKKALHGASRSIHSKSVTKMPSATQEQKSGICWNIAASTMSS